MKKNPRKSNLYSKELNNWNLILYTLAVVPLTILVGFLANRLDALLIRLLSSRPRCRDAE